MERQAKWEVLPPEIWGSITDYLGAEHIGIFKLTGDKALWRRLTAPRAVKRLKFEFIQVFQEFWPGFVNELRFVEDIEIDGVGHPYWQNMPISLQVMPKKLRKLSILIRYSSSFYQNSDGAYSIKEYLPCLEELNTTMSITPSSTWQAHLPDTLTHLTLDEWCLDRHLPPSLTSLKAGRLTRTTSDKPPVFPPQLVKFECLGLMSIPGSLDALPTSLRKLSAKTHDRGFEFNEVEKLPREITDLEISLRYSYSILSCPPSSLPIIAWPSALTRLSLKILSMVMWKWLPQTLNILILALIPSDEIGGSHICFEDLPKSLTHLKVGFEEPTLIDCSGVSEPQKGLLNSESEHSQLFPPKLKLLECENAQFTLEAAKQIPRSVTLLHILQVDSDVCGALPNNSLQGLIVSGCIVTAELLKNLPRSLTSLVLPIIHEGQIWIVVEDGGPATYADLARSNPEKYGHKIEDISMLWQEGYVFPPSLTHLQLPGHEYLDDRFVSSLPTKLEFGDFQSSLFISDLSIHALPRGLTSLNLSDTRLVTSKSFKDLPRPLVFLSLASSSEIYDQHIKDLPRGLGTVHLNNAILLTNFCIQDLPRSIEELSMEHNELITSDSFHAFPPRMRTRSAYNSFRAATWQIENGEVIVSMTAYSEK
jgi:hypothetical protein